MRAPRKIDVGSSVSAKRVHGMLVAVAFLLAASLGWANAQEPAVSSSVTDSAETHVGRGYDALKQDRYDEAASEFRAALALDSSLIERARFPLAVALFESHKSDEARKEFETVRQEVGGHPNVLYYLGRLDLDDHKFDAAIQDLKQAVIKPPFPDTAYYLGFAYFKQGRLVYAERWLKEAVRVDPKDSRAQYQLGLVYRRQGRAAEAKKALALSEQLRQGDAHASQLRLDCRQKLDQGLTAEARAVCDQLYDPDDAERLTELGTIYAQHGNLEAALKPLRRAAELAPKSPQMQYNLALAYFQLNQFTDARPPLETALKRWPDLFQLNALYGAVLLKLGEDAAAYQALRHAHDLNPQDSGVVDLLYFSNLGLAQKSKDAAQYSDALHHLEEAAKLRPVEPTPHQRMADIYALTARESQATAEQQEADRLAKNLEKHD
ncbi:MAG: tetratricopeptide repeat protein [Acidobacteriia bacterium]|nr:tetratricopeptide repeat protein [Terriglobia bacterium]